MTRRLAFALLTLISPAVHAQTLESLIPGLQVVALGQLPAAPAEADAGICRHKLVETPDTPAGRLVSDLGWGVTAEVGFGTMTAVSFVGGYEPGTSGSCLLLDGNVGFFSDEKLVALVYSDMPDEVLIGFATPLGREGIRLWSGDYVAVPLADIQLSGDSGVTIGPLSASQSVCDGSAEVPLIYGLPIDQARERLAASGWQPVPGRTNRSDSFGQDREIAAAGVIEVEDCSGTGFAFCSYVYASPGAKLTVITMGEIGESGVLPSVSDYGVDCG